MSLSNDRAVYFLKNAWDEKRFSHAYLIIQDFNTVNNSYNESQNLVNDISIYMNNISKNKSNDLNELNGIKIIRPLSKSRNILIDDINNLENFLRLSSVNEINKIVHIYDCHRMNERSSNALLKTLEEPPKDSYFFLITNQPELLLNTIKSRCISIRLNIKKEKKEGSEPFDHFLDNFETNFLIKEKEELIALLNELTDNNINRNSCEEIKVHNILNLASLVYEIMQIIETKINQEIESDKKIHLKSLGNIKEINTEKIKKDFDGRLQAKILRNWNIFLSIIQEYIYYKLNILNDLNNDTKVDNLKNSRDSNVSNRINSIFEMENLRNMLNFNINKKLILEAGFLKIFKN